MKKVKVFSLSLLTLFLMFFSFVIFPVKVFADSMDWGTAGDWYNHISQFEYGFARCEIAIFFDDSWQDHFGVLIVDEPSHEFDGYKFEYGYYDYWHYFEPGLADNLQDLGALLFNEERVLEHLETIYGEDYDGFLYWNFENHYWQIAYYDTSDFDNNNNNNKEVDMVTDLLDTLAEIGAGIGDLFGKIVESVGQFFYTPGTGDNPGSFTIIGILTIAAVVVSLSMWVLRLILRLFKLRG